MNRNFLRCSKKNKLFSITAYGCIAIAIIACGEEVTNVTENSVGVQSYESQKKLPKCTKENQGEMGIVVDEGMVYFCDETEWKILNGKDGKNGKDGIDGKNGEDGIDGKDGVDGAKGEAGKDGVNGKDGKGCTAKTVEDGIEVSCGGNVIGTINNGVDGAKGEAGKDGVNCTLTDNGNGIVTVTCGENSTELFKAKCGTKSYNPDSAFCDNRDSAIYKYVVIGTQTWMAENLNYRVFYERGGEAVKDSGSYCYGDDGLTDRGADNCAKYGRLYTWAAAMDSVNQGGCGNGVDCTPNEPHRGACSEGWHVPEIAEIDILKNYIESEKGNNAGYYLKSLSGWNEENGYGNGVDHYGFNAFPAGNKQLDIFQNMGTYALFWATTKSKYFNTDAFLFKLVSTSHELNSNLISSKENAMSVRCIKDSN